MSEREELAAIEWWGDWLADLLSEAFSVGSLTDRVRIRREAYDQLTSRLRAHDGRIRAEALAPVLALIPTLPEVDAEGMIRHGDESHGAGLQCSRCPGYPHNQCVSAAALRAAAGTPTHDTTEEDA